MDKRGTFTITMDYLRDIVAKQTFHDSPAAALRELIQNAHDACLVQSALTNSSEYSVHVTLDPFDKKITIEDNGVGMTESDIHEYLTTVGRGKKGATVAEKYGVTARNSRRLQNVIGEFGFGFVAAFIIADRIELWTRSAQSDAPAIHCVFSTEDVAYQWEEVQDTVPIGTKLVLYLNQKTLSRSLKPTDNPLEGNILSWDTVDAIVKKYCIFLEFPIFVSMEGDLPHNPSNLSRHPWEAKERLRESVQLFYENRFGKGNLGEFLHVIPVSLSRQRGDAVDMDGVLIIEDAPRTDDSTGSLEIFVKQMWVCEHAQYLLPAWASFLRGIIITPELHPVPGRDSLDMEHDSFDLVKKTLHHILSDGFLELARKNAKVFNTMLDRYGLFFRWGLVQEKKRAEEERRPFQEGELLRYVRFVRYGKRYMGGNICTLNEYLDVGPLEPLTVKDHKRVVYLVARPIPPDRQAEFRRLLASKAVDVIVPNDESEYALLWHIEDVFPSIITNNVEYDLFTNFGNPLKGEQRARWSSFLRYYQELCKEHNMAGAEVGAFEPEYMPTMIFATPIKTGIEGSDNSLDEGEPKETPPLSLIITGMSEEAAKFYSQTLVINSRNRIMKQLLEYKEKLGLEQIDRVLEVCLHQCYHMALQAAIGNMPSDMLGHHVEIECKIIQDYVESRTQAYSAATEDKVKLEQLEVLRREHEIYQQHYGELPQGGRGFTVPPEPTERMCAVVFCDMVSSTGSLVGMDFDQRGLVLNQFVTIAKEEVHKQGGFFDKFTGDGLIALFGIDKEKQANGDWDANSWIDACKRAWMFSQNMHAAMVAFNSEPTIRRIIERNRPKVSDFQLRIAIHAGYVLFARFGGGGTAVGLPVIAAARLCAAKELFEQARTDVLVTEDFVSRSSKGSFTLVAEDFVPKGIDTKIKVYRSDL